MTREERAQKIAFRLLCGEKVGGGDGETYIAKAVRAEDLVRELLAFADAEAAAMRQFVSLVASLTLADEMAPGTPCEDAWMTMDGLIRRARVLPTTGEVGRG